MLRTGLRLLLAVLQYGLQHVGLDPKRDNITLVQVGGLPEIMASLTSGKLDGAMLLSVYAFSRQVDGLPRTFGSRRTLASLFHKVLR